MTNNNEINNTEIFKDIPNYEGLYQASNLGRVKSIALARKNGKQFKREKLLAICSKNGKFPYVQLGKNNTRKSFRINYLVAITFLPQPDKNYRVINKDGNQFNNRVNNLEWWNLKGESEIKNTNETEIWKSINNYENYEVSNIGRIRSLPRQIHNQLMYCPLTYLNPFPKKYGYLYVSLRKNGKRKDHGVHRLVGQAFVENLNPEKFNEVNHLDSNPKNNITTNLEWTDHPGNMEHAKNAGRLPGQKGEDNPLSKLTEEDIKEIRRLRNGRIIHCDEIAKMFNISSGTVRTIATRHSWKHIL